LRLIFIFITILSLLFLTSIVSIGYSDSGYTIIWHGELRHEGIPIQTGLIVYNDEYEYLLVYTTYNTRFDHPVDLIYYFPLPSKPIASDIVPLKNRTLLFFSVGIERIKLKYAIKGIRVYFATAGGYSVLGEYVSEYFNISLIETREASLDLFKEILSSKGYTGELPEKLRDAINYYIEKGWKYFAIGIIRVNKTLTLLQQYVFQTDKIIYPLYIDKPNPRESKVTVFIVTNKALEKYINPLTGKENNPENLLEGIDLKVYIRAYDTEDREKIALSISKILGNKSIIEKLGGMISLNQYSNTSFMIKGIVYSYQNHVKLNKIKHDLVMYPSETSDLTLQTYPSLLHALPPLGIANALLIVPLAIVILIVSLYLEPVALFVKVRDNKDLKPTIMFYSGFVIIVSTLIFIPPDESVIQYYLLYRRLQLATIMLLLFTIPYFVALTKIYPEKYDKISKYAMITIGIVGFTIWNPLSILVYIVLPILLIKLYLELRGKQSRFHNYTVLTILGIFTATTLYIYTLFISSII